MSGVSVFTYVIIFKTKVNKPFILRIYTTQFLSLTDSRVLLFLILHWTPLLILSIYFIPSVRHQIHKSSVPNSVSILFLIVHVSNLRSEKFHKKYFTSLFLKIKFILLYNLFVIVVELCLRRSCSSLFKRLRPHEKI